MNEMHRRSGRAPRAHPAIVRLTHWISAAAMVCMIMSGWRIYNASPILPFTFPEWATIGGWLGGALNWHFAAMWALAARDVRAVPAAVDHLHRRLSTDTRMIPVCCACLNI
jgi:thiosulfate reductase cytochrome b subunit